MRKALFPGVVPSAIPSVWTLYAAKKGSSHVNPSQQGFPIPLFPVE
mgnify:CR=1 FL=1